MNWYHYSIASIVLFAVILNMHVVSALSAVAVAAPSGLEAEVSFDGRSVSLSWIDNSDDETGFIVERASGSNIFAPIATKGANVGACTDTNPPPDLVSWRVKAIRNSESSVYCTSASATITGDPTFAITNPKAGDSILSGCPLNIRWFVGSGAGINSLQIKLSTDRGRSWEDIYPGNAVEPSFPDWGNWSWVIPAGMVSESAMVRVHEYGDYNRGVSSGIFLIVNSNASVQNLPIARSAPLTITQAGKNMLFCVTKKVPDKIRLVITTIKGTVVFVRTGNSGTTIRWTSANVPAGHYIARLTSNTITTSTSFIVLP